MPQLSSRTLTDIAELEHLLRMCRRIRGAGKFITIARNGIIVAIYSWVDHFLEASPEAMKAANILFDLPVDMIEKSLEEGACGSIARLIEASLPALPDMELMPKAVLELSNESITKIIGLGFPYHALIGEYAAEMWLSRGVSLWRGRFSSKTPPEKSCHRLLGKKRLGYSQKRTFVRRHHPHG